MKYFKEFCIIHVVITVQLLFGCYMGVSFAVLLFVTVLLSGYGLFVLHDNMKLDQLSINSVSQNDDAAPSDPESRL